MRARSAALILMITATSSFMPASAEPQRSGIIDPSLSAATGPQQVLVRFLDRIPRSVEGMTVHHRFQSLPAVFGTADPRTIQALARRRDVVRIEANHEVRSDMDVATVVTRARAVWEGQDAIRDAQGRIVDGAGIGIAIVDTGIDTTHPDFAPPGKIGGNFVVTPAGMVAAPDTAIQDPHGTHVAGIAAGSGSLQVQYKGVAPGASLYGFEFGGQLALAAIAFDWLIQNGGDQDPPIRIVNNSWSCPGCSSWTGSLHIELASALAEAGIAVAWSAGNLRGDGDTPTTNPEAINTTAGIIGVGSYNDRNVTDRSGCLSGDSAWGASARPETWPDLVAPGQAIASTWAIGPWRNGTQVVGRNPVTNENAYRELTGTSMAAPHIAGVVALMAQANPTLTPAEAEYILKQTATPLTGTGSTCTVGYITADPAHPETGANYVAGHGLVDAQAAVSLASNFAGIPAIRPSPEPIPESFIVARPGISETASYYLTGEDALTTAYPDAAAPRVRPMPPQSALVFESEVRDTEITFDAFKVDAFLGTSAEQGSVVGGYAGQLVIAARIAAVEQDGSVAELGEALVRQQSAYTLAPVQRRLRGFLPIPVTIPAGSKIRLTISVTGTPYGGVEPGANLFWALYSESFTPSRVVFGTRIARPDPASREGCETRWDCAMIDAAHPYETLWCGGDETMRLSWTGPVGSTLVFNCDGLVWTCPVVEAAPGSKEGSCTLDVPVRLITYDRAAMCTAHLPGGESGGRGRCQSLVPLEDA